NFHFQGARISMVVGVAGMIAARICVSLDNHVEGDSLWSAARMRQSSTRPPRAKSATVPFMVGAETGLSTSNRFGKFFSYAISVRYPPIVKLLVQITLFQVAE